MMSRRYKRVIGVLAALCGAALVITGCGSKESMTEKTFKAITEDTGVHMKVEQLSEGARTTVEIAKKGDNLYANVETGGTQAIVLSDGKTITALDPASKTMVKQDVDEASKKQLEEIESGLQALMKAGDTGGAKYEEGTVKYDGEEYATEIFKNGDDEAVFGYKDGKLGYFSLKKDGATQVMKILAMDGEVDEALFLVPEGYTEAKKDSDPEPQNGGDVSYKSIEAPGASVGSSGTGTPTGDYVDVNNDRGGFAFEMDKAFTSENEKDHSYVFTEKGKKTPHFDVEPVQFGGDVDRYFDTLISNLKGDSGVEMAKDPVRTKLNVKGTTVKGIEYVIKTGSSKMVCMFYIYPAGTEFYKFAGFYMMDDMTTPYALQHALETFRTA